MEVARSLSAEEDRRRKLQEYLAAKGKLKPQNDKPYLKDSTNLQRKGRQPSKQISEKKDVPRKGTKVAPDANRTWNTGLPQSRPAAGKITTQQTVLSKKNDHNPAPSRAQVQRVRPGPPGRADHSKHGNLTNKLLGRKSSFSIPQKSGAAADIGLTVVLTKHGDKSRVSDVHLVGKTFVPESGSVIGNTTSAQITEPQKQTLHQPPVKKSQSLPSKAKPECRETHQPTGKAIPPGSNTHIRIISRVSQLESNRGTPSERSFLIKSSRTNHLQPQRPLTVRTEQKKPATHKPSCATKTDTAVKCTSATAQKKLCPHPVSAAKAGQDRSAHTANKVLPTRSRSISKPAVWQKNTRPTICNRTDARLQTGSAVRPKGTCSKPTVTNGANQTHTSTSSNLPCVTASDATTKPHTPKMTVEDRKKKLQEWLVSKGKTYKRPPMQLPPKRPPTAKKKNNLNLSVWQGIEEEEELLLLSKKISQSLSECLQLIDKGVSSEDIHAALDKIPEGERFAKYWVCKAQLLERDGITDVMELYKQGVQSGTMPIEELREAVFDIMKNTNNKSKVVTFGPLPNEDSEQQEEDVPHSATSVVKPVDHMETSCFDMGLCDQGSAVKYQVACLSSKKKRDVNSLEWKCLTPVRRSLRIHHSASQYPDVLQEHDPVVASLDELLDMADTDTYLYVRNEALPEEADYNILSMVKRDSSEGEKERPVGHNKTCDNVTLTQKEQNDIFLGTTISKQDTCFTAT